MNFVLDITVIIIIVVFVISGYKRGIINSVVHFVGAAVASVLSSIIGSFISVGFYNNYIKDKIIGLINDNMPKITMSTTPDEISATLMKDLPDFAKNALDMVGISQTKLTQEIKNTSLKVPEMVETLIRPIAMKLLTIVLTLAVFTIIVAIISIATQSLTSALDVVGLSTLNKILGAVLGVLAAAVIIMIVSLVMYILIVFLPADSSQCLTDGINSSYIYKGIYNINVPEAIISNMINI